MRTRKTQWQNFNYSDQAAFWTDEEDYRKLITKRRDGGGQWQSDYSQILMNGHQNRLYVCNTILCWHASRKDILMPKSNNTWLLATNTGWGDKPSLYRTFSSVSSGKFHMVLLLLNDQMVRVSEKFARRSLINYLRITFYTWITFFSLNVAVSIIDQAFSPSWTILNIIT